MCQGENRTYCNWTCRDDLVQSESRFIKLEIILDDNQASSVPALSSCNTDKSFEAKVKPTF